MLIKCSLIHPLVSPQGHSRPLRVSLHVALFCVCVEVLVIYLCVQRCHLTECCSCLFHCSFLWVIWTGWMSCVKEVQVSIRGSLCTWLPAEVGVLMATADSGVCIKALLVLPSPCTQLPSYYRRLGHDRFLLPFEGGWVLQRCAYWSGHQL
jgi:hypothetical protein